MHGSWVVRYQDTIQGVVRSLERKYDMDEFVCVRYVSDVSRVAFRDNHKGLVCKVHSH